MSKQGSKEDKSKSLVLWFDDVDNKDVSLVGGKNASLGEMYRELTKKGINIPHGFAVTAHAYQYFLEKAQIKDKIKQLLEGVDKGSAKEVEAIGSKVRATILKAKFPEDLDQAITQAYTKLEQEYNEGVDVAVRSSATAEDLPEASFAGQQETFLNITGSDAVLYSCKRCMASLFTTRAICYRAERGFDHMAISISVGVQKMVRSDEASSGVMFSIDTETGFKDVVLITGSWGLGENIVGGVVTPDEFLVHKSTLVKGYKSIVSKKLGTKEMRLIYAKSGTSPTKNIRTSQQERERFCLDDEEVLALAQWAVMIEDHYSNKSKKFMPMDIEWAKDGLTNELFIVQARPETVQSRKGGGKFQQYKLAQNTAEVLCTGISIGKSVGQGVVQVIKDVNRIHEFKDGSVLVTSMTDPDWEPILRKAKAIITDRGGRTCHAAIVSREIGIPCIVGCGNATDSLKNGQEVTLDCSGEKGRILAGIIKYDIQEIDL